MEEQLREQSQGLIQEGDEQPAREQAGQTFIQEDSTVARASLDEVEEDEKEEDEEAEEV